MKDALQIALDTLRGQQYHSQRSQLRRLTPLAKLIVTLIYLVAMLSLPSERLAELLLYAIYPIIMAALADIPYGRVLRHSMAALPLLLLVGIFNPLFDRLVVFDVGGIAITRGWITFISIIVRGILSIQATLLLVLSTEVSGLGQAAKRMGVPALFVDLTIILHRYLTLLIEQLQSMMRAKSARSQSDSRPSLRLWATIIGHLFLRTANRAESISRAMKSRGSTSLPPPLHRAIWHSRDTLFTTAWAAAIVTLRLLFTR